MAYVETANLDGETNLKIRQALPQTAALLEAKDLNRWTATIECEPPNRHLYEFNGNLREQEKAPVALGPDQIFLRGAKLRNTHWAYGAVIYTGHESKFMKNSSPAPLKRSTVDKATNWQILWLFLLLIVLCLISAIASEVWNGRHLPRDWYLGLDELSANNFGYNLLTFIILYNNLIPISLLVTIEVVRFIQAGFISMDLDMYFEETDTPAVARTSNLNEELGQVKYILSDKTGTLTKNVMDFKSCSVAGEVYPLETLELMKVSRLLETRKLKQGNHEHILFMEHFMVLLSSCHTVIPERDATTGNIVYHAASPDERALVRGAAELGYVFTQRTPTTMTVDALGQEQVFEVLHVLEFTSQRKRMSLILRNAEGKIMLYSKGADTVIYERLAPNQQFKSVTLNHLEMFATQGLRTLCCAVAEIDPVFYESWKETYHKASIALHDRENKLDEASNLIERNLTLLGATAIEDKLQDQVPETISALQSADIAVWILTGDKQETAINIGYACKLLTPQMVLIIVNEPSLDTTREMILRHISEFGDALRKLNDCGLIIDGTSLKYALSSDMRRDFLDLCISCRAVICCRVTPMQKAEVVELLTQSTGSVTLAIGDGANDVAMIQKAHVGVGISGQEGMQAVCASDYAIAQFKFLRKLLFVHGSWCYHRMCKLILYSFYKNICLYIIELWYAIWSAWSGQTLFERWCIGLYNVIFTVLPPLALGLFDRICSAETMLKYPGLYKMSQDSETFNVKTFWFWVINSILHSILLFWLPASAMSHDVAWGNGRDGGYLMLGNMVYTYVVVTVCLKAGLEMNCWTVFSHLAIWGSISCWFLFFLFYSALWPVIPVAPDMAQMASITFSSPVFWFGLFLFPFIALLGDLLYKVIHTTLFKSLAEDIRESEIKEDDPGKVLLKATKQRWWHSLLCCGGGSTVHPELPRGSETNNTPHLAPAESAPNRNALSHSHHAPNYGTLHALSRQRHPGDFDDESTPLIGGFRVTQMHVISMPPHQQFLLTETARLLKNVKNVFRRTTPGDLEVELSHGYAFSQEEHGAVSQSEVIRAYDTSIPKPGAHGLPPVLPRF
ncbi:unnamed protein product [Cyprideis torosa]|uniref:Phospholipid-transporting ATPase n=1 Tax=Cyprideis torosa TaxID=163714 RepID=A0A7R8WDN2_9CRUS|nr:unnamed protein product [Cyprideis torosa]CAG0894831.1 unnamed protein product [Cyprideis torosa]